MWLCTWTRNSSSFPPSWRASRPISPISPVCSILCFSNVPITGSWPDRVLLFSTGHVLVYVFYRPGARWRLPHTDTETSSAVQEQVTSCHHGSSPDSSLIVCFWDLNPIVRSAGWPAHTQNHCSHEQCFSKNSNFLLTISRNNILVYFSVLPNSLLMWKLSFFSRGSGSDQSAVRRPFKKQLWRISLEEPQPFFYWVGRVAKT